jgi:hypothetical protein
MKTSDLLIYGAVLVAVLLLVSLAKGLGKRKKATGSYEYAPKLVLTKPEQVLFHRLREALASCIVLAQVSMHRVIKPKGGGKAAFNTISQKAIDFVICRPNFSVICVVELDDLSHNKDRDLSRDTYMTGAGIETLRWEVSNMPAPPDIALALRKFDI